MRKNTKIVLAVFLLCLVTHGCSTYNSKFKDVIAKIRKDKLFQSLNGKLRYEVEGGKSETIPYVGILYLDYVDPKTSKAVSYRCRYHYQLTWREGEPRDWNWALGAIHEQLPSGKWEKANEVLDRPDFLKMLRP